MSRGREQAGTRALVEPTRSSTTSADLRGVSQLVVDAVVGVTNIVEDMHRNIASIAPIFGPSPIGGARGISGLVYRSVRGVARAVGIGLNAAWTQLAPLLDFGGAWPGRDAALAAINGVLGDHLVASHNPLAIPMQLRQHGEPVCIDRQALGTRFAHTGGKLLVLVHGLCMSDLQWTRYGHDHGTQAARDFKYTSLYLHYNSGRHISANGRDFAHLMERLIDSWPVPVSEIVIVGHSMGGLVARSACHHAFVTGHAWLSRTTKLLFLGTPHHGAPLERVGSWVNALVGISPYSAPFMRLGNVRSAGIRDLSHGFILDEDRPDPARRKGRHLRKVTPLPAGVQCFAIAAVDDGLMGLAGDGLVPVASALGQHRNGDLALTIPAAHQAVFHGLNHFDLLSSLDVYERMTSWLATR